MFQEKIQFMLAQSPQMQKGTAGESKTGGVGTPPKPPSFGQGMNQGFQQGANAGQAGLDINQSKQYGM